jgi:HAD superfamily hydrolase (TIGR01490 family)
MSNLRTKIAAFFDVDHTVLRVNSGTLWMKYLRRRGEIGRLELARAGVWALLYKLAVLDMDTLARRLVADLEGQSVDEMRAKADAWWHAEVRATIAPKALAAIEEHRQRGELCVLLTGGSQFVAEPLMHELKLDGALCSQIEHDGARFTGKFIEPLCFGHGKIHWAERWASEQGVDLARSSFYTDSYNDLPMLERVGLPVVVNPDVRLGRVARRRGWPIHNWGAQR